MATETTGPEPEETGGEAAPEQPSRIAGAVVTAILAAVALLILRAVVTAAPYTAYFVAGVLVGLAWQRASGWIARRRTPVVEEEQEAEQPDVAAALRDLVGDDRGVLLTVLRDHLKLPDTKAVKALLDAEGIPWKPSRTREGNGPAVRKEAIPPAPSPAPSDAHGHGCCCRSGDNDNDNNAGGEGVREGVRVVRNQTGVTIYDLADNERHHKISKP
ncbi:hypothetical protein AB0P02_01185 [Streptomyces griseoluteus]|uniref:hypothetical protein n=1 Tax=Streptomyces griseoluteus TaxID=29306 RepID=UPI00343A506E